MFSYLPHHSKFLDQDSVTAWEEKHLEKCTCPASALLLLHEIVAYISFSNTNFVTLTTRAVSFNDVQNETVPQMVAFSGGIFNGQTLRYFI
jgi:hypothetical protein